MKYCILLLILLATAPACAAQVDTVELVDYEAARLAAVDGWEDAVGPVTHWCYNQTKRYWVDEIDEVPCGAAGEGYIVTGCVEFKLMRIWIYEDLDESEKGDTAIHEFIHALSRCELEEADYEHADPLVWVDTGGSESAEGCGQAIYGGDV